MFHLQPVGGTRSRSPGVVGNFELLKSLERINMLIFGTGDQAKISPWCVGN